MSRHTIPALNPAHKVTVGWDSSLRTYFGDAVDKVNLNEIVLWVGTDYDEVQSVTVLVEHMTPVAVVTPDMELILLEDRRREEIPRFRE